MVKFEQAVKKVMYLSTVVAFGAGLGLYILSKREVYFAWAAAELIPMFGYPLLGLLLLSCIFGGYGVILLALEKYNDVKGLLKDLKDLKNNKKDE